MTKATYDLQPMDTFRHLNGKLFTVVKVDWVAGDNYVVICLDAKDQLNQFLCDVHTSFDIVMTYSKAGA
jgi:hypothetical protein